LKLHILFYISAGDIQATANIDSVTTLAYDMTITVSDARNSGTPRKLTIVITGKLLSYVVHLHCRRRTFNGYNGPSFIIKPGHSMRLHSS